MKVTTTLAATAISAIAAAATAAPALAHTPSAHTPSAHRLGTLAASTHATATHAQATAAAAVFVQTDNTTANSVAVYQRGADGRLYGQHLYATGGRGGMLSGAQVDDLASEGSLTYDASAKRLFAVNAGSDTITSFEVDGTTLKRLQVLPSGGDFPVSITVHDDTVYVLNALNGGSVYGYKLTNGRLTAIAGSTRALGLNASATPQYTTTPGQVSFTPDGKQLLVTTKGNTNAVEAFAVDSGGVLSATATTTTLAGEVPFAVAFTADGEVAISEAGTDSVADFTLAASGALTQVSTIATGGTATCWLIADGDSLFAGNAGSATESTVHVGSGDALTLADTTATDAGTVDATTADDGHYLYVQTGAKGIVDEFAIGVTGSLDELGSVYVPGAAGGEGIAAS